MKPGALRQQVNAWILQTAQAGQHLVRLYRRLGDAKQAATAMEVTELAERRARQVALSLRAAPMLLDRLSETEAEARAWEQLVEAQAGLCAFHAMVVSGSGGGGGVWSQSTLDRALRRSIRGLQTAFPESIAREHHQRAIHRVSITCAALFIEDLGDEGSPREREVLYQTVREGILQSFPPLSGGDVRGLPDRIPGA